MSRLAERGGCQRGTFTAALCLGMFAAAGRFAEASFHFMQIELVVAGVDGDPAAQAIQLRMRSPSQNFVSAARLYVHDAGGANPILLVDFDEDVAVSALGSRILIVSEKMASYTSPAVDADYVLTELIPQRYLQAGSLTFENDDGTLLVWRFSWGGDAYTGQTLGALTNDDDRDFGPPWPTALPTETLQGLLFDGAAADESSTNAADYVLTTDAAVLTNNAGQTSTVTELQCPNSSDADDDHTCDDVDNCVGTPNPTQEDTDGDGLGNGCDGCPNDPDKAAPGVCGCGHDDDDDDDADGVIDCLDNCPGRSNADQADADDDGVGDACGTVGGPPDNDNGNDNDSTGNDNDGPDNANDNDADNDNQDDSDVSSGGAGPRGCGVALMPVLFCFPLALGLFRRRPQPGGS